MSGAGFDRRDRAKLLLFLPQGVLRSASDQAESMRNPTRFGKCGLAAWMCSFCLSAATGLPPAAAPDHPGTPVADEDSPLSPAVLPSLRQIQEQNLAVLKAVEHLGEDRDAALHRYTETIT